MDSGRIKPILIVAVVAVLAAAGLAAVVSAQSAYKLRSQDSLLVTVGEQPDLTKKYVIDGTGHVQLPLIGLVRAEGLTVAELTAELRRKLNGYLVDPQVRVDLERAKKVFVFGGVATPGSYELTDRTTLIEVLAKSGYGGAAEALIIRPRGDAASPAVPADQDAADVIRVNLRELEKDLETGNLSRNVLLEEGDTIYVPRFDPNRIYVSGAVRSPGAFSVPQGTTVLQAVNLAGGPTPNASLGRTQVLRLVGGKQESIKVKLDDVVKPGDTILVRERLF